MQWLVRDAYPHDALFFHYKPQFKCMTYTSFFSFLPLLDSESGPGGRIKDPEGDEAADEAA